MPRIWVAQLEISKATAHKISTRHGVNADEITDAVQLVTGLEFVWDHDPERGSRAILRVEIRERIWFVVLYPDGRGMEDVWHLGSAYEDK